MDLFIRIVYNIYIRYGKYKKRKRLFKMKNVVENLFLLFAIGVIIWIICSYVNIVANNDTVQAINNYADWNAFAIFSKIIK